MLKVVTLMFQEAKVDSARHMPKQEWWMFVILLANTMDANFVQIIL
jgi:hypothetical protein